MSSMIGVDIGGTFTDCVIVDPDGAVRIHKRPSTPHDPAEAFLNALDEADVDVARLDKAVHGTTVAANTLIQRNGAPTGLITTRGFRDVLEIGRSSKPPSDYFNLRWRRPEPLVPRNLRLEVTERVSFTGEVLTPLVEAEVVDALDRLVDSGCTAVAVCLLFSFASAAHEVRIGEIAAERHPELAVSLSSQILPQWKEYERTSTTVVDAYVKPRMSAYFERLAGDLATRGFQRELLIMKSNGGLMTAPTAARFPVHTALSGPAAAALAGRHIGISAGWPNVITMDMGGTSFDVSLVQAGELPYGTETEAAEGTPVLIPTIDIRTIGAGGGSVGWLDAGGGLKVGPRSAGAVPGPVCYRRGGTEPTVTDANLVLGRLGTSSPLAGDLMLDRAGAEQAIGRLADQLGLSPAAAAGGLIEICVHNMANETRSISAQRGFDPRDFVLVAAGGAGPLHAALVAEALGAKEVLVPPRPGLLSAAGLLLAEPKFDVIRSWPFVLERQSGEALASELEQMADQGREMLRAEGFARELTVLHSVDARYAGQNWEINVPLTAGDTPAQVAAAFDAEHERLFGVRVPGALHEVVNLRTSVLAPEESPERWLPLGATADNPSDAPVDHRSVHDPRAGEVSNTPVYRRELLPRSARLDGPCVIEQEDTTTFVPCGWKTVGDERGNLVLSFDAAHEARGSVARAEGAAR
jgi:N-methylhydantoinase A